MAGDESVGRPETRPELCDKVVIVFTSTMCWDSSSLLARVMAETKMGQVTVTRDVRENNLGVEERDAEAEALVNHVLGMCSRVRR